MRTIIAGSREGVTLQDVTSAIEDCGWEVTTVISGTARGVDMLGEVWAEMNDVPIERYPADWDQHGKKAGYIRNVQMAGVADALVAVWDGQSKGTSNMIDIGLRRKLLVSVYRVI